MADPARGEGAPAAPSPQAVAFLNEIFEHAYEGSLLGWSKSGSLWWPVDERDAACPVHDTRRDDPRQMHEVEIEVGQAGCEWNHVSVNVCAIGQQ